MVPRKVLFFLALSFFVSHGMSAQLYTYLWQPKSTDVGEAGKADYNLLNALLLLSRPQSYSVAAGDSLDFIIRKRFLVSAQFPHAYGIYMQRILRLNPGLETGMVLRVAQLLQLPGGPKYSASELSDLPLDKRSQQAQFASLSQKAYDTYTANTAHFSKFASRTLSAFVMPQPNSSSATAFRLIQSRGLVAAIDLFTHPRSQLAQAQPIDLYRTNADSDAAIAAVKAADPPNLFAGTFAMSSGISVPCPTCLKCNDLLNLPLGVDVSKARVLIEDTGIAPGIVDGSMILPQTPDPATLAVPDPTDQSADKHGTFVFSQIAAPTGDGTDTSKGLIPKSQVLVAKVARTQPDGTQRFFMSDILNGWKAFEARLANDKGASQTWVVNLSMFGEDKDSADLTPAPPRSDHLLIVAAAGNEGSYTEPGLIAFSRLSGPGTALLSVGALNASGDRASYSNYDPSLVQLFARGDCVCGSPNQLNGTSQATPIVATAAAILASARPQMKPLDVKWRLISTADTDQKSAMESLGGRINLKKALSRNIIVEEDMGNGQFLDHQASSITFSPGFKVNTAGQPIDIPGKELLRLSQTRTGDRVCFNAMQVLTPNTTEVCVSSAAQVSFTEKGSQKALPASSLKAVIAPLPSDRDSQVSFPTISLP